MLNGRQNRRCSATWPYCLFFILPLAAVLFYYRINMEDSAIDWRHKTWMQYNATKWWSGLKSGIREKISLIGVNWNPSAQDMKTGQTSEPSQLETQQVAENQPTPACLSPYIVAYPSEYHFIINEPTKCEEQKPFVALMVPVAPHNRRHRDIIRNTWGGESVVLGKVVNVFFLMGLHTGEPVEELEEHLQQESKEHEDLIQSNFLDCYNNLTIKTMVILEWLNSYCSTATYAMKIDSDTYLSVRNLITMLSTAPKTNYMTGLVAREAAVLRDPTSKWYLPVNIYPKPLYPRYALGLGYVLSMDLPKRLVEATRHVKAIYIEDVYLGLCMEYLGIPPTDPPNWDYFHVFPVPYNRCAYSKLVVTTLDGDTNLTWVWKDLHKAGKAC